MVFMLPVAADQRAAYGHPCYADPETLPIESTRAASGGCVQAALGTVARPAVPQSSAGVARDGREPMMKVGCGSILSPQIAGFRSRPRALGCSLCSREQGS